MRSPARLALMVVGLLPGCSRTPLLDGSDGTHGGRRPGEGGAAGGAGGALVGGSGGTSGDAASTAVERAFAACRQAILAQCERLLVCEVFSVGDCEQYATDRCPGYYFGPHTLRTVEGVEACVPLIRRASCTDVAMGLATQCLPAGTGAAGDPCSSPGECAANACSGIYPSCGTCAVPLGPGASCDVSVGHCASGTLCHPRTRVCVATPLVVAHAAAGEACDTRGDPLVGCEGDLVCKPPLNGGTAGRCAPLPGPGEPCLIADTLPECAPGLFCGPSTATGARVYRCGSPVPCGTTTCDSNSFCHAPADGPEVCRRFLAVGGLCSRLADSERQCAHDAYCAVATPAPDGGRVTDGICIPLRQVGEGGSCADSLSCRASLTCQAGHCARFDPASCYDGN